MTQKSSKLFAERTLGHPHGGVPQIAPELARR